MKAVIDRFEGDYAVVLCGDEETRIDMPRKLLPPESQEGSWLHIAIGLDPEATKKQEQKIKDLLDKLRNKPR